jgi:hypothetical protein
MAVKKMTEKEICEVGEIWFKQKGWDLFPEVVLNNFGGRPDFVATKGRVCAVIEAKTSLSFPLIEQLTRWTSTWQDHEDSKWCDSSECGMPHYMYCLTGGTGGSLRGLKKHLFKDFRLGWIHVELVEDYDGFDTTWEDIKSKRHMWGGYTLEEGVVNSRGDLLLNKKQYKVTEIVEPRVQPLGRKLAHNIIGQLQEDMKQAVAGVTGSEGNYMTPFKRTLNRAYETIKNSELKSLHPDEILAGVEKLGGHHYASDRGFKNSIGGWLLEMTDVVRVGYNRYGIGKEKEDETD